ncbi:MFS transporter [Streptomyces justiciae]|uniref:MFS transporter n=1 Tax=Streptomyces justiciae TaxID=2780140 RepID=UPI0018803425|nr:MFS transporter [Streptomyces justiciae]MBE8473135.1 MFS transporter [Streptomyces justiciae]
MRALREVPRAVWLLACGTFVNMVVSVGFAFVFLYATGPRELGAGAAGVLVGVGGAGLVAGNFTGGWYGDRFGHRRVLLCAAVVSGVLLGAVPLLSTPVLYVALPLAQYASGVQRAAQAALVAVIVPEGVRRQAFAVVRAAANGGFTVGPVLGALVATRFSYDWLYVGEGVGSVGLAWWTGRVVSVGRGVTRRRGRSGQGGQGGEGGGVWGALRARPAVLVLLPAIVVIDVVYRQQYSTFPVFLADHGMDARVYGTLLAVNGGILLCLEVPVAVVLRKRSPLRVVGVGLVLVGAGYGVLLVGAGVGAAVVMMALLTLGEALYKTTATAYVADQAPDQMVGRFQSLYAGASISGVVLAAPLGGGMYAVAPGVVWPVCAGLGVGAGVAVLLTDVFPRPRRPYPFPSPGAAAPSTPPHLGAPPPDPRRP